MKLGVFMLTILSCGAAMADIVPENQVEGKQVSLVRIPRRFRFRLNFRRRYKPKVEEAYYPSNPYGVAMGKRKLPGSTTTSATRVEGETTLEGEVLGLDDAAMAEVREDATVPAVREDATAPEGREDATVPEVREDATLPAVREDVTELQAEQNAIVAEQLPGDWIRTDNGEFKFHKEGATWDEASFICNEEGGFLTVLNNDANKDDLLTFLKDPQDVTGSDASWMYYLGYSGANGEFQITPYGAPASATGYSPWCENSPANVPEQKCGVLDTTCQGLIEVSCSLRLAYFCSRF